MRRRAHHEKTAWRASWKGDLRFGLVRLTVEAINAHSASGSDIHFHQLHAECHSRIEYHKVCPIHGEVDNDEIVLGYEYSRGQYIEIDPEELDAMRSREERALAIEEFISPDALDPIYYDGRMYYLVPAKAGDRESYHLLRRALVENQRIGVGQVIFSGKEQLATIQPRDEALVMAMLNYGPEIRDPHQLGLDKLSKQSTKNLKLAKDLIRSMESNRFSIDAYEDHYRDRVEELVKAKRRGKPFPHPREEEEKTVINLSEALRKSVRRVHPPVRRKSRATRSRKKPAKQKQRLSIA